MTFITWFLRLIIFSFLVVFALQNTDQVILRLLPEQVWQAPLVIFLLVFFVAGALMGVLSVTGVLYRQRREIARLKRLAAVNPPEKPLSELPPAA
jgi:uncharacterized integral membrane protein